MKDQIIKKIKSLRYTYQNNNNHWATGFKRALDEIEDFILSIKGEPQNQQQERSCETCNDETKPAYIPSKGVNQ